MQGEPDWQVEAQAAADCGRFFDAARLLLAQERSQTDWTAPALGRLACNLLGRLGYGGLAQRGLDRLHKLHPDDCELQSAWALNLASSHQFLPTLDWLAQTRDGQNWPSEQLGLLWYTRARIHIGFHDWFKAERALQRAEDHGYRADRLLTAKLSLLTEQNQLDTALKLAEDGVQKFPRSSLLAHFRAWLLFQLQRENEAMDCFSLACDQFQDPGILHAWAAALADLDRYEEAQAAFERFASEAPRLSPDLRAFVHNRLSRIARRMGDLDSARAHAKKSGAKASELLQALQDPTLDWKRLEVPFQRQSHLTCAPASVAAILGYFDQAIDQSEIAAQITYDGTHDRDLRAWLEEAGFVARFFTPTQGIARKLIDRGLPFSISTRAIRAGHRTTVIGYDAWQDSLLVLDPGGRYLHEFAEDDYLKQVQVRGGVGLLVLPESLAQQHASLELAQEAEHQVLMDLGIAIDHNDVKKVEELEAQILSWPQMQLRWQCEQSLAWFRNQPEAGVRAARSAYEKDRDDACAAYEYAQALQRDHQVLQAREIQAEWAKKPHCPEAILRGHARSLAAQPGKRDAATQALLRGARYGGRESECLKELIQFVQADPAQEHYAAGLARIATCAAPHDESVALRYADVCVKSGQEDEALRYLTERKEAAVGKSAYPAVSLAKFLQKRGRSDEALELLAEDFAVDAASASWLLQTRVQMLSSAGRHEEADQLFAERGHELRENIRLELQASLARASGNTTGSVAAMRQLLQHDQSDAETLGQLLELLTHTEGKQAAIDQMQSVLDSKTRVPVVLDAVIEHALDISELQLAHHALDTLKEDFTNETWLRIRRCRVLLAEGRHESAEKIALQLTSADRLLRSGWSVLAMAQLALGKSLEARAAIQQRIALGDAHSSDYRQLLQTARDGEERGRLLAEVQAQFLADQPSPAQAHEVTELAESTQRYSGVHDWLVQLCAAFPHVREFELELIRVMREAGRYEEAVARARACLEADPKNLRIWISLADSLAQLNRRQEQIQVLEQAIEQHSKNLSLEIDLGLALAADRQFKRAEEHYLDLLQRHPESSTAAGCFADLLWTLDRRDEALTHIHRACAIDPDYEWAWSVRNDWLDAVDQQELAVEHARELARLRADNPSTYTILADACQNAGLDEEGQQALEKAIQLDPTNRRAIGWLVFWHRAHSRFEQAVELIKASQARLGNWPALSIEEGLLLRQKGQDLQSRDVMRQCVTDFPDSIQAWQKLLSWQEEDQAADELRQIAEFPPACLEKDYRLPLRAGLLFQDLDDHAQATQFLYRARELAPQSDRIHRALIFSAHHEKDRDALRLLLNKEIDYDNCETGLIAQLLPAAIWLEHPCQDRVFDACLRRKRILAQPWASIAGAFKTKKQRRSSLRAAIDRTLQKDSRPSVVTTCLLATVAFEALDRKIASIRNELQDRFVAEVFASEEGTEQLERLLQTDSGRTLRGLAKWLQPLAEERIELEGIWGSAGYFFAPTQADWVIEQMLPRWQGCRHAWMISNLVDCLFQRGRFDEAEPILQRLRELPRDHVYEFALILQMELWLHQGDYQSIRETQVIETDLEFSDLMRYRTLRSLAKIEKQSGYSARRRAALKALRGLAVVRFTHRSGAPYKRSRDLRPMDWFRLAPCPSTVLMRLDRLYFAFLL